MMITILLCVSHCHYIIILLLTFWLLRNTAKSEENADIESLRKAIKVSTSIVFFIAKLKLILSCFFLLVFIL